MTAAIYARQSREKKDSLSIAAQVEKCRAFCDMRGWEAVEYLEPGLSGKDTKRPRFQEMIQDVRDGRIGAVVAYKYDRIGRNLRDILNVIYDLEQLGCKYVSINENFDTSTPIGRAAVSNILTFAQFERETIAERLRDNFRYRTGLGRYSGGKPPFGYRLEKSVVGGKPGNVMVPDEREAPILREMYRRYLGGESLRKLAIWLNESGVTCKMGGTWSFSKVARTLKQPAVCAATPDAYRHFAAQGRPICDEPAAYDGMRGLFDYVKIGLLVGPHAPIIEAGDWIAAQERMKQAAMERRFGTGKLSWLSGIAACAVCGGRMGIHTNNYKYPYLQCANYSQRHTCTSKTCHMARPVERVVEAEILAYIAGIDPSRIEATQEPGRVPHELDMKLLEIDKRISNLVDAIAESGAGEKHLTKRLDALEAERVALSEQANQAAASTIGKQRANERLRMYLAGGDFSGLPVEKKREFASCFISLLTIAPDEQTHIEWRVF